MTGELYDELGERYTRARRTDPRIAAAMWSLLGDVESVLNVGAGTGSYEPRNRNVVALEPSQVMRRQRPPGAAECVAGVAEALPFAASSFDAAMSVCSDWFWPEPDRAFAEMKRVARERIIILTVDRSVAERFWLSLEYLPGAHQLWRSFEETLAHIGPCQVHDVPIPGDCIDGFFHAYWRRPHAYLDSAVRESMAVFERLDAHEATVGLERLAEDLKDGSWHDRHWALLELGALDLGYRVLVASADRG
jgi:SAM-dependent methyltransferase